MKFLMKGLATAAAAVGATALVLGAALPASAATTGAARHGNYETISGILTGPGALANSPVVRVQLSGAVNARGSINLGGNAPVTQIPTNRGTLTVRHGNPNPRPRFNYRSCRVTETTSTSYTVLGRQSSGAFSGAQGNGRALVVFSATVPRYTHGPHRGQCNFNGNPRGASISFYAQGPLNLRHH